MVLEINYCRVVESQSDNANYDCESLGFDEMFTVISAAKGSGQYSTIFGDLSVATLEERDSRATCTPSLTVTSLTAS